MKRNLVEIYALAVCFVTVCCFAIAFGVALYDIIQISYPEFTISSHQFEKHKSNEAFIENMSKYKKTGLPAKSLVGFTKEA